MYKSKKQFSKLRCFLHCSGNCDHECKSWLKLKHAIEIVRVNMGMMDHIDLFEALGIDERIIKHSNTLATKDLNEFKYDIGRNKYTGIEYVDTMSGDEFESFIKRLYQKMGFKVTLTKKTHDGGIDASALKDNVLYSLQCKRFKSNIGVKYIREFTGVIKESETQGIFITTSNYTRAAIKFALKCNIQLINRNDLIKLIEQFLADDTPGFKIKIGISSWSVERASIEFYLTNTSKIKMTNISDVLLCFYNNKGILIDKILPKASQASQDLLEGGEDMKFKFEMKPIEASYSRFKFGFDRANNEDTFRRIESSKIYLSW